MRLYKRSVNRLVNRCNKPAVVVDRQAATILFALMRPVPAFFFVATAALAVESFALGQTTPAPPPVLTIDAGRVTARVSPTLYGLMTEEINYSYEGGLYGELIRNRIFRDDAREASHWSVVHDRNGIGAISLDESQPIPGTVLTKCVKLDASQASTGHRIGVANDGYWGIPVKPKTSYQASFYAKETVPTALLQ